MTTCLQHSERSCEKSLATSRCIECERELESQSEQRSARHRRQPVQLSLLGGPHRGGPKSFPTSILSPLRKGAYQFAAMGCTLLHAAFAIFAFSAAGIDPHMAAAVGCDACYGLLRLDRIPVLQVLATKQIDTDGSMMLVLPWLLI